MFLLLKGKNKNGRQGLIQTKSGGVKTPVFMPIATRGAIKNLTPEEVKNLGAEIILGNTYHLWLRPGLSVIKKFGGLHKFINWSGPILTDSGGYQIFSLDNKVKSQNAGNKNLRKNVKPNDKFCAGLVKITDEGAEFKDPLNGKKYFMSPEDSIQIQLDLGADIIMVLDHCPAYPVSQKQAKEAVKRTTEWAIRCKDYFDKKIQFVSLSSKRTSSQSALFSNQTSEKVSRPLLFGIVQGSIYQELRRHSAKELLKIGFDGYAIGGVAVGEPRKYLWEVLKWVLPLLPKNKPRYLMGLGRPEEIVGAARAGIDMFDCVIPTREARHGRIYKFKNQKAKIKITGQDAKFYEIIQITNAKLASDFNPIDKNCSCYTCQNYSRAYLNHLFKIKEPLAMRLATTHNLKFYLELMEKLREQKDNKEE